MDCDLPLGIVTAELQPDYHWVITLYRVPCVYIHMYDILTCLHIIACLHNFKICEYNVKYLN